MHLYYQLLYYFRTKNSKIRNIIVFGNVVSILLVKKENVQTETSVHNAKQLLVS